MIKGMYAAASAMVVGLARQSALSHNVANLDTPGFKQILTTMDEFTQVPVISNLPNAAQMSIIGQMGLGVELADEVTDYVEGALRQTGQPLDLAIHGEGFFHIETPNGERYTRDGRLTLNADNQLTTIDGYFVLDTDGNTIELSQGDLSVSANGTIAVNGDTVTQIGLVAFENPGEELTRDLPGTFAASVAGTTEEVGTIQQGYLETSNVNVAQLVTQMISVARAYDAAQKMVQVQDQLLGRSISTLGRI